MCDFGKVEHEPEENMPSLWHSMSLQNIANPCTVKFTVVLPVPVFGGDFTLPVYKEVHGVSCLYLWVPGIGWWVELDVGTWRLSLF